MVRLRGVVGLPCLIQKHGKPSGSVSSTALISMLTASSLCGSTSIAIRGIQVA